MSTNCLVTKLKDTVDADLDIFDVLTFNVPANINQFASNTSFQIGAFPNSVLTATGDVTIYAPDGTLIGQRHENNSSTLTYNNVRIKSTEGGTLKLTKKYSMLSGETQFVNIYQLRFGNDTKSIGKWLKPMERLTIDLFEGKSFGQNKLSKCSGNFKYLFENNNILSLLDVTYCPNIYGDVKDLQYLSNTLTDLRIMGSKVGGNIEDLGECVHLIIIVANNGSNINDNPLTGTIEGFVARQRAAGRTTAEFTAFDAGFTNVTFNGHTLSGNNTSLSWTADTITCYGETINA